MHATRIIPCLLLRNRGLVKTVRFDRPVYVGDPMNAVRIFNDKEADELVFLDITASRAGRPPDFALVADIASECFMPFCYGGGIRSVEDARRLTQLGAEKIVLNTAALADLTLVSRAAGVFGSQSVVVGIDVRRGLLGGYTVHAHAGGAVPRLAVEDYARAAEQAGAGEILLTSVDRDGMMAGYDLELLRRVTSAVGIPVVACGGAGSLAHLAEAVLDGGASAAAAGSLFVFQGRHKAVLINYPTPAEIRAAFARGAASATGEPRP
jgi:cyclase